MTWAYFILWNIKDGILKTVGNEAVLITNDFHWMNKKKSQIMFPSLCYAVEAKTFICNTFYVESNKIFISKASICNAYLILSHLTQT